MLRLTGIRKAFGSTLAVADVSLAVAPGEIVGLVGENGAGKTTLMSIAAGELSADSGSIERSAAVGIVHQHFALVDDFTIAENLALARERRMRVLLRRTIEQEAERVIAATGIELAGVTRRAAELSVGEQSKLELIKAVAAEPQLLILDEPTSVLTPHESAELFRLIRRLAAAGTSVVFISHKVPEVLAIAQRVVVMRHGTVVADSPSHGMTGEEIAAAMVGDPPSARQALGHTPAAGPAVVEARDLRGSTLDGVTLSIRRGEIVAVVGVAGNGQAELAEIVRGMTRPRRGSLAVRTRRVAFVPEDRTRHGLIGAMTLTENLALGGRHWNPAEARRRAESLIRLYDIRARGPQQPAAELSGGNQQKVILARELDRKPELIIASEPTRGLDISAASFVHDQLRTAVAAGAAVLLITSDLDEAFTLADVLHVIYRGRLSEPMPPAAAESRVANLMAGVA